MDVLTIADLAVRAGPAVLLRGLRLSLAAGERVALVGPSGSGKSLTAAALVGSLPPGLTATGSVRVGGHEVLDRPAARRIRGARVGLVAQQNAPALHPLIPVGRQLTAAFRAAGDADAPAAVRRLVADLGLTDPRRIAAATPGELSGGQRQRLAVAMALAAGAPVLVADEPTSALDPIARAQLVALLRDRCRGTGPALLFITHDLAAAAELCDRTVELARGRMVEPDRIAEVGA